MEVKPHIPGLQSLTPKQQIILVSARIIRKRWSYLEPFIDVLIITTDFTSPSATVVLLFAGMNVGNLTGSCQVEHETLSTAVKRN